MPLGFVSDSHGQVAFGFFNIETDLLLLDRCFFFAPRFCRLVADWAGISGRPEPRTCTIRHISSRNEIGDLMGAIHGLRLTGFIGEVYLRFPFPSDRGAFHQKPYARRNHEEVENILQGYGRDLDIVCRVDEADHVWIGEYAFSRSQFHELVRYVWLGGYPRWQDASPPDYVLEMRRAVDDTRGPLLAGLDLDREPPW